MSISHEKLTLNKGRTVVLNLFLPECMYEITFKVVRGMLEQRSITPFLANLRIAFSQSVQAFLLFCLDD